MKIRLKLDKASLISFGIHHGEKVALGVVVLLALLVVYLGWGKTGHYERGTPADLAKAADNLQQLIKTTPTDPNLTITDYATQVERSRVPIQEEPYVYRATFDPPLFKKKPLRGAPKLFTVEELRGQGEIAGFYMAPPEEPANKTPRTINETPGRPGGNFGKNVGIREGRAFVSLVGLVPYEKQLNAYRDVFRDSVAPDPLNDIPNYRGYWVERVEITNPNETTEPDWDKAVKFRSDEAFQEALNQWDRQMLSGSSVLQMQDVVDKKFLDEEHRLVFPLGPRIDNGWGDSAAHSPEIPSLLQAGNLPGLNFGKPVGQRSRSQPFRPGAEPEEKETLKYRLFRFLDFQVEPGKYYRYRVRLALRNPNHDKKVDVLQDVTLRDNVIQETEWSAASAVIAVPQDVRVLVKSTKAATRGSDASADVIVTKWIMNRGREENKQGTLQRGQMANFGSQTIRDTDAIRRDAESSSRKKEKESETTIKIDYATDAVALDFRGGAAFDKKEESFTELGALLLLDVDNNLVVHTEMDDMPLCAAIRKRSESTRPTRPGGPAEPFRQRGPTGPYDPTQPSPLEQFDRPRPR